MTLTFGSLFAGIGGFDLGFERAGMVCKWQVEIDDYANKVLRKHWPDVHRERDIRQCGSHNLQRVDVICGGFPCQDISYAGRGAGLAGERSGLFFEAVRLVRQLRPRAVVLENVAALYTRGLDVVLGTLAGIGYDCEWDCIPAVAVGAPHLRKRVFVVAYAGCQRRQQNCGRAFGNEKENEGWTASENYKPASCCERCKLAESAPNVAYAGCQHRSTRGDDETGQATERKSSTGFAERCCENVADATQCGCDSWARLWWHAESSRRREFAGGYQDSGYAEHWAVEPAVGRVAHGVPRRVDRLRGIGNAVVPQVAEVVGRRVVERLNSKADGGRGV